MQLLFNRKELISSYVAKVYTGKTSSLLVLVRRDPGYTAIPLGGYFIQYNFVTFIL
jgi:hypothetical protein